MKIDFNKSNSTDNWGETSTLCSVIEYNENEISVLSL